MSPYDANTLAYIPLTKAEDDLRSTTKVALAKDLRPTFLFSKDILPIEMTLGIQLMTGWLSPNTALINAEFQIITNATLLPFQTLINIPL